MNFGLLDTIPWLVFCAVWLFSAPFSKKTVERESIVSRLSYSIVLAAGVFCVFSRNIDAPIPWLVGRIVPDANAMKWSAFALISAGLAFAIWARVHLGRLWSGSITLKEGHHIVESGPYAWSRHPIYTGLTVAILGTALATGSPLAFLGVPIVVVGLALKLLREEKLLTSRFPEQYDEYAHRVKRLVPFVW